MIDVTCPSCGETYHVKPEHLGKSLRCRRCDQVFTLQDSSAAVHSSTATSPGVGATTGAGAATGPSHPIAVTDRDFAQSVLASPRPVLVDFWAPWCGPCRALAPAIEQLAQEYGGRVTFAKLNTDENPSTMTRYGVMGLPTMVLFKGGQEADRLVGLQPKANIKRALDRLA